MSLTLQFLAYTAVFICGASITAAAVRLPRRHPNSGEIVLRYSWAHRLIAVGIIAMPPVAATIGILLGNYRPSNPGGYGSVIVSSFFFAPIGGFMLLETACLRVTLTTDGIDLHAPLRRGRFVKWEEITKIGFNEYTCWFSVRDTYGQNIRVHAWLQGIIAFVDLARKYVPYEQRAKAQLKFEELDNKAGPRHIVS